MVGLRDRNPFETSGLTRALVDGVPPIAIDVASAARFVGGVQRGERDA